LETTYDEFLFETINKSGLRRGTRKLSDKEFKKLLFENCKEFLENPMLIWKNSNLPHLLYYTNPKSTYRYPQVAKLSNLMYQYFLDTSEKWKHYPKRSNAVICYSRRFKASHYGNQLFNIIPYDNSKWVISKTPDFWHTFKEISSVANFFNTLLNSLVDVKFFNQDIFDTISKIRDLDNPLNVLSINSNIHKKIINQLHNIKLDDIELRTSAKEGELIKKFKGKSVYEMLNYLFNPTNSVNYSNYEELKSKIKEYRIEESDYTNTQEIYTDSKCLYAPENYMKKLLKNENI